MKRVLTLSLLLWSFIAAQTQNYPSEWNVYTSEQYFCAIENGINEQNIPEENFRNNLLDMARTNLAKQIEVKVNEVNLTNKEVVNGNANIHYSSHRMISTNVDMKFAESKSHIDIVNGRQHVIVYINKEQASKYYENELKQLISTTDNSLTIAENYKNSGFKSKAKEELNKALVALDNTRDLFFWLNVFGMPDYKPEQYINNINQLEQTIKKELSVLEYGTTYCIMCKADNFGHNYLKLRNEIKGDLSEAGCNFVDDLNTADYVIYIDAASRQYNTFVIGNVTEYFSYVDAVIAIDKVVTNQRIFEDEISAKGSHTLSFDEAGRDGFKKIRTEISKIIKENIKS